MLIVIPFDDDDDAVRIANDNQYGLGGYVTSGSVERATAIGRRLRAGIVSVNGGVFYGADAPFGGYKASGVGARTASRASSSTPRSRPSPPAFRPSRTVRVSFVGAGQIGGPMSERLLAAGHDVTVYARRAEVREHFAAAGATVTDSLVDAALDADVVHGRGVLGRATRGGRARATTGSSRTSRDGALLVSHTTGSPATIRRIAEAGEPHGVHVVDAPFSGGADQVTRWHAHSDARRRGRRRRARRRTRGRVRESDPPDRRSGERARRQAPEQRTLRCQHPTGRAGRARGQRTGRRHADTRECHPAIEWRELRDGSRHLHGFRQSPDRRPPGTTCARTSTSCARSRAVSASTSV